jgi:hypothetical protein
MSVEIETVLGSGGREVRVAGDYPAGTAGNAAAAAILKALDQAVAEEGTGRVALDMSRMTYAGGDAIGSVFLRAWSGGDDVAFVLNVACAPAWKGLLALNQPVWDALRNQITFKEPEPPCPRKPPLGL